MNKEHLQIGSTVSVIRKDGSQHDGRVVDLYDDKDGKAHVIISPEHSIFHNNIPLDTIKSVEVLK